MVTRGDDGVLWSVGWKCPMKPSIDGVDQMRLVPAPIGAPLVGGVVESSMANEPVDREGRDQWFRKPLVDPLSYEGGTRSRIPVWAYLSVPGRPSRYTDGSERRACACVNHGPQPDPIGQDRIPLRAVPDQAAVQ